jgi:hypothetical protein
MSEPTPIAVLKEAAERGLTLSINGRKLRVTPAEHLTPDFYETLRQHKWHLLTMLSWPFCMAYSKTLGETIFFCEDEATKAALIEAGADCFSIYTKDELRVLVANNRVAPLSPDELRKVHEIKRTFNGTIVS